MERRQGRWFEREKKLRIVETGQCSRPSIGDGRGHESLDIRPIEGEAVRLLENRYGEQS